MRLGYFLSSEEWGPQILPTPQHFEQAADLVTEGCFAAYRDGVLPRYRN